MLATTSIGAIWSSFPVTSLFNVVVAAALSPDAIAFLTFFTAVRNSDLRLALRMRVASACRARLRAWAELAMVPGSLCSGGA